MTCRTLTRISIRQTFITVTLYVLYVVVVESCPLTKLNGGLARLHSADEDAVSWLTNYR